MVSFRTPTSAASVLAIAMLAAACTGDDVDLGPNDPAALAPAAALTEDDLPEGDWQAVEQTFDDIFPAPDPDATPLPLPPELESCDFLQPNFEAPPTPPPSMTSAYGRTFFQASSTSPGDAIFTTTQVFATQDAAQQALTESERFDPLTQFDGPTGKECQRALAAFQAGVDDGSAILVRRELDLDFEIGGVEIQQVKTTISSSAGVETSVSTTATFVRGHVLARYVARDEGRGAIDHEQLIRAFIQRVTDAQLADRAVGED